MTDYASTHFWMSVDGRKPIQPVRVVVSRTTPKLCQIVEGQSDG